MDILAQYEKQNSEQQQVSQQMYEDPSHDHGPIIRLVMKISGGRIQSVQQANIVLLSVAVLFIITGIFLIQGMGSGSVNPETFKSKTRAPEILLK